MNKYLMIGLLLMVGLSFAQWIDPYLGYKYQVAYCQSEYIDDMFDRVLAPPNGHSYCTSQDLAGRITSLKNQMYEIEGSSLHRLWQAETGTNSCYLQSGIDRACVARYRQQYLSELNTYNSLKTDAFKLYMEAARGGLSQQCMSQQILFSDYMYYWYRVLSCNGQQNNKVEG